MSYQQLLGRKDRKTPNEITGTQCPVPNVLEDQSQQVEACL